MTVTSKDMENGKVVEGRRKASAVVSRAQLAKSRSAFERTTAALVLVLSLVGTVVAMHGGWSIVLAGAWSVTALVGALLLQGLLTALQWWYGSVSRFHPAYLGSLGVDVGLTVWGYGPLLVPVLAPTLGWAGDQRVIAAWLIIGVVSFLAAWYPESRFVD